MLCFERVTERRGWTQRRKRYLRVRVWGDARSRDLIYCRESRRVGGSIRHFIQLYTLRRSRARIFRAPVKLHPPFSPLSSIRPSDWSFSNSHRNTEPNAESSSWLVWAKNLLRGFKREAARYFRSMLSWCALKPLDCTGLTFSVMTRTKRRFYASRVGKKVRTSLKCSHQSMY